jgi:MYXO-CTERM domain-containing protein
MASCVLFIPLTPFGVRRESKMRVHRSVRSPAFLGLLAAAFVGFAPDASASEFPTASSFDGPNRSSGAAQLRYSETKSFPTDIDTGFIGPEWAKIRVGLDIAPVTPGSPLYTIDMPRGALIEANWGSDRRILLKASSGNINDGLLSVRHTVAPTVSLTIPSVSLSVSYNAGSLVNKLPGAQWDYDSRAQQSFMPWGFQPIALSLSAVNAGPTGRTLFSMDTGELFEFRDKSITGRFGVNANAQPTFSYKTTKIAIAGADGAIMSNTGELSVNAIDGDYMEVMTTVEGEMIITGNIGVAPFFELNGVPVVDRVILEATVLRKDFVTPSSLVQFPPAIVHIPMPNVHVPSRGVDVGYAKGGATASKRVRIDNTGEKDAVMTFKSSDRQFSVPSETVTVAAKSSYDVVVRFNPESDSAASADITVRSNDADAPEQRFRVGGNGADVGDGENKPEGQDGCGCKTAGAPSSLPAGAGFGLFGLASLVLARRRRR